MPKSAAKKATPVEPDKFAEEKRRLALVSELDIGTMTTTKALLLEAQELQQQEKQAKERLDEIRKVLCEISDAYELGGLRVGNFGLVFDGYKTRRTLDTKLLLENGVDAQVIAASYSESEPYVSSRFMTFRT